ncbi:lactosylceramide 1,3-N-acetyl-beta-D-glucosaminyltransferase A-like [Paramacrobiotus metropolitanus]|uniref:lactosylceramide 1,3-N-acetyl-beta-D-glucosaminyltransferase A-like n=1 Tax=Paramacrobiotus metropolitanus TaxID=2943436 RepID=UPI0024463F13|nr:lactosylceramide 1,3-N-acetyl-beta-D-glucosaminyltransferase A-like [Paramacrobiotus metropolitanus]
MQWLRRFLRTRLGLVTGVLVMVGLLCVMQIARLQSPYDPIGEIRVKLEAAYATASSSVMLEETTSLAVAAISANRSQRQLLHRQHKSDSSQTKARAKLPPKMDFAFPISRTNVCFGDSPPNDLFLLIIVHSAASHFHNRELIRETWANEVWRRKQGAAVLFIVGTPVSEAVQTKVVNESVTFGDIIQYNYLDTYRNMTHKNLAGLTYISQFCQTLPFSYILKTDDDMFVYLRPIVAHLRQYEYCHPHATRTILCAELQRREVVQRDRKGKWFVAWEDFPDKHYPPYCYGGGYVLTRDLVEGLLSAAGKVPFYWIDDVFVTGLTAKALGGVQHVQFPGQNPIKGYVCDVKCMQTNRRWFMHTLQRADMIKNYYRVVKDYGLVHDNIDPEGCPATKSGRR